MPEREWKFTQWFRKSPNNDNMDIVSEDVFDITAVEFDETGEFLATGDNSGNVVVLRNDQTQANSRNELVRYTFHCEFKSHDHEFDFVTSQPIPERINAMKWGPVTNDSNYLLCTNMKHIKLWKISEGEPIHYANWNTIKQQESQAIDDQGMPLNIPRLQAQKEFTAELKVPKHIKDEKCVTYGLKKWYPYQGHIPPIMHLAVTADQENFMSADFFKINLWDLYRSDTCFTVADFLPKGGELEEVLTVLDSHPLYSNLFVHGSNTGKIRLCDLRVKALAQQPSKEFCSVKKNKKMQTFADHLNEEEQQSLFDEVTSGVAAVKFSKGGKYIVSRDYMSVKIWDTRYEKRPFETFYVHEFLREGLFELYQSQQLADAFGLGLSANGNIVTGSYSNYFHLFELSERQDVFIQASSEPDVIAPLHKMNKRRNVQYQNPNRKAGAKKRNLFNVFGGSTKKAVPNNTKKPSLVKTDDYPIKLDFSEIDFEKKVVDCAWHPNADAVAVTAQNSLFIYSK